MKRFSLPLAIVFLLSAVTLCNAEEARFTVVHSNDLHSHLLGASPNIDYTPGHTGDDTTTGGWARIATVIRNIREDRKHPVLVFDGGDFLMGSLFHMVSREAALELRLMAAMGYDAVTLGNHEFDLKPGGLARILETASSYGEMPPLVLANAMFSPDNAADDKLESLFRKGLVKPYIIRDFGNLRVGIFGLLGKAAAEVAPFSSPVRFEDPAVVAAATVAELRRDHKVDVVVCLSHSGLWDNPERSEDEILAKTVPGIDLIVSGHTHTQLDRVLHVGTTMIVQSGEYGKQVGVLDLVWDGKQLREESYQAVKIDDAIAGDPDIIEKIAFFEEMVAQCVLADKGWDFRGAIAETDFSLRLENDESNLGNLIADAIRWDVNRYRGDSAATPPVQVALISNGVIRDPIEKGRTGRIAVCDAFRALPLGIGFDEEETMGYPLIAVYVYPAELKKALEILTSIYPLKGSDYFLQVSGLRFSYNPHRMIFDRVTDIFLEDENGGFQPLDVSRGNRRLIGIGADIYNATFLKIVGNFTWHILDITPKDASGAPISDLRTARIDADPERPGIQELKEWAGLLEYIAHFPDTDGDGLPEIPASYSGKQGRHLIQASWNPYHLLRGGSYLTWSVPGLILVLILILTAGFRFFRRRFGK